VALSLMDLLALLEQAQVIAEQSRALSEQSRAFAERQLGLVGRQAALADSRQVAPADWSQVLLRGSAGLPSLPD
jgi:hypothetical protein